MIVLPIIRNLGGLKKNQAKNPRAETTQAETTQGWNEPGPKQLRAETTRNEMELADLLGVLIQ